MPKLFAESDVKALGKLFFQIKNILLTKSFFILFKKMPKFFAESQVRALGKDFLL